MEKLKKIIHQLDEEKFKFIEQTFISNHSKKFLTLLQYYRDNQTESLTQLLSCNDNALYVLKSRLYDKLQKHLLEFMDSEKDNSERKINNIEDYLTVYPRDTAIAMLHELEKKYLQKSDFVNLISLYSVLKKAYHHSDKYYHYTQLYNKHVAYAVSLEKSNDVLLSFNKTLSNYYFSDSIDDIDTLVLLKDEIKNICFLNKSHNIELIYNIVLIQLYLFTPVELNDEDPIEDIIKVSDTILDNYKEDPQVQKFKVVFDFLKLEYYNKINQHKKLLLYYDRVNEHSDSWMLNNNYCLAFKFLLSKLQIIHLNGELFERESEKEILLHDFYDFYSIVVIKFYHAIKKYYSGEIKEAISLLNKILDDSSFVNFSYMEFEIKLTLAYFYYRKKEYEMGVNLLKNLYRKVSGQEYAKYANVKTAIKLMNLLFEEKQTKSHLEKMSDLFDQFNYHNFSGRKILLHIQEDINSHFNKK